MPNAISSERTVPVSEDLTTEELRLSVLRGNESMYRVDKKVKAGESFAMGEWAVLNADGELERPSGTAVPQTYLVFAGTDRFDAEATGQATVILNSNVVAKSNQFDPAPTYAVGMDLTVKDLGGGEAVLTEAGGGEPVLARVLEHSADYLVYETKAP